MRLIDMATFIALVKNKHFGRTAMELHTTQPAVSTRLSALEQAFGCRLIERSTRDFNVTWEGEQVLKLSEETIDRINDLRQQFGRMAQYSPGTETLRIGLTEIHNVAWIPSLIGSLRAALPGLELKLQVDSAPALAVGLTKGNYDIVFSSTPVKSSGVSHIECSPLEFSWVGSPRRIEEDRTYTLSELQAFPVITPPHSDMLFRLIITYFEGSKQRIDWAITTSSIQTMIRLAADGHGIALVPTLSVAEELVSRTLIEIKTATAPATLSTLCSYQVGQVSPSVLGVLDAIKTSAEPPRSLDVAR